jgi:hypothetical protein
VFPFLDADQLDDTGRWRELGITHWHLTVDEIGTGAGERYSRERWHGLVGARFVHTTADPREALHWITDQRIAALKRSPRPEDYAAQAGWGSEQEWLDRLSLTWFMLTHSPSPAGGGFAISDGRSVEIYANPMSAQDCSGRH